jgi:hypothetical protein
MGLIGGSGTLTAAWSTKAPYKFYRPINNFDHGMVLFSIHYRT